MTMTMKLELDETEIEEAVSQRLVRQGYKITGLAIEVKRGYDAGSPAERSTPDTVRAVATVEKAEKPARSRKKGGGA